MRHLSIGVDWSNTSCMFLKTKKRDYQLLKKGFIIVTTDCPPSPRLHVQCKSLKCQDLKYVISKKLQLAQKQNI